MAEKSSYPWNETFYSTFPHAGKGISLLGPEDFPSMGKEITSNSKDITMQEHQQQ
jgi:hypothetical protein